MGLIELILLLAIVGFVCYLVVTYIPMPPPFRQVIIVVFVIALLLYLLKVFVGDVPLTRVR